MKRLKLFEKFTYKDVKIKSSKFLFDDGYQLEYEIYTGDDYIGKCEVQTNFLKPGVDDTKDDLFYAETEFDFENPVKKEYYKKLPYIIQIDGFEIEEEFKGKGLGLISFKKILESIREKFPNNTGIYLNVYEDNEPAVKIYQKLGFKVCRVYKDHDKRNVLVMKL